jgi:predicted DsbA family dithiol-disulfide isomerase
MSQFKINCSVQRDAASLIAPDTIKANKLLQFASYEFDLSELYARKLQKEIYEQKKVF